MTWYYGHFHGVMKRKRSALVSSSDDSTIDSPNQSDENESSDDDMQQATRLSTEQCEADHQMALQLQKSLDAGVADKEKRDAPVVKKDDAPVVKFLRGESLDDGDAPGVDARIVVSSSDSETNEIAGSLACKRKLGEFASVTSVDNPPSGVPTDQSLFVDDKCYIASKAPDGSVRFQTCFVKSNKTDILTGLVTHYDVALGFGNARKPPTRRLIEAVQAHEDLAAHYTAKKKRLKDNLISRQMEQEELRLQSAERFRKGQLAFVPGPSPGNSPDRQGTNTFSFQVDANDQEGGDILATFRTNSFSRLIESSKPDTDEDLADLALEEEISEEDNPNLNESGLDALELSKSALTIELSTISSTEIWEMLTNKSLKGGIMARTLFIAGKALESRALRASASMPIPSR